MLTWQHPEHDQNSNLIYLSALEQYRLDKSDLYFGRAQGAAKLALELSIITADQFVVYTESLIWERNNA